MIKIEAKRKGNQTALEINLRGSGEELIQEAVAIMMNLPKQLSNTNKDLFKMFVSTYDEAVNREVDDHDE